MNKNVIRWTLLAVTSFGLVGCGSSAAPTGPPTVITLPAPPPTTTTTTTLPPFAAACGSPAPPPLYGIKIKVQTGSGARKLLDSRPIVRNIDGYCGKTGQGSGKYCDTRIEGDLQREACDALVMGKAKDTGRYGPTWSFDGKPCTNAGEIQGDGCVNYAPNQFLVVGRGTGELQACAADDVPVEPLGGRCANCILDASQPLCQ